MYLTKLASAQLPIWNVLEFYGQDAEEIFRCAHLDPALMHQQGARCALHKINLLWREAAKRIPDPCFGLRVADNWHPSNFGALGYAMLVSKSLRITLERLIRFHQVISDSPFGRLEEDKHRGTLNLTLTFGPDTGAPPSREDAALAWIMSVLRVNYQKELSPASVDIVHSKPVCSGRYYEFFRSHIVFNSEFSTLRLPLELVDKSLPGDNEELADFGEQMMIRYVDSLDRHTLKTKVKKRIAEHLPSGNATLENVASELAFSTRTLQRMLQQENSSFLQLLNETRKDLAIGYVNNKNLDLTEVAFLLGFAELSTFSRSFKRWTGLSPSHFRKAA
ncbi:AraC family transcriptional regulator [Desulfopila sp. IMCC35008]|uniref:AraC family transcriptional regulator n=1 Tax=Desulfopila sp. IMCC35008 TaxID=2653858 RepID=UPI0013D00CFC|nr:AraC family transcriptional regulator [Desulfopila sp. IMCC35008]